MCLVCLESPPSLSFAFTNIVNSVCLCLLELLSRKSTTAYYNDIRRTDLRLLHQHSSASDRPLKSVLNLSSCCMHITKSTKWNFFYRHFLRHVCVYYYFAFYGSASVSSPPYVRKRIPDYICPSAFCYFEEERIRKLQDQNITSHRSFTLYFLVPMSMFVPIRHFAILRRNERTTPTERG